jgi:hypothetical protein
MRMLKVYDRVLDQRMQDIENFGSNDNSDLAWIRGVASEVLLLEKLNSTMTPQLVIDLMATLAGWYEQMEREGRV